MARTTNFAFGTTIAAGTIRFVRSPIGSWFSFSKAPFDPNATYTPKPAEEAPKKRSRRSSKKREDTVDELKKATDDLNDAVTELEG